MIEDAVRGSSNVATWCRTLVSRFLVHQTGAKCLQYADFVNESTSRRFDWRLTDWSSAVPVLASGTGHFFSSEVPLLPCLHPLFFSLFTASI